MPKCGIRGTATARLAFHDMRVPATNILGPLGKGLKVALTVLDFGRTTFGASCTGAGQGLPRRRTSTRRATPPVRPAPRRPGADQEEDRLSRRDGLRDGSHHLSDRRLDRSRGRGLHARDRHPQGLLDRSPLAGRLRDAPGLRRPGLFQQRALRADDARRADQYDRRGGQRGPQGVHRAGGHARHRRGTQGDPRRPQAAGHVPADLLELHARTPRADGPDSRGPRRREHAPADGRVAVAPGRAVRSDRRAAPDRQPRGDPGSPVHPGAGRRRRHRPGHLRVYARRDGIVPRP